MVSRDIIQRLLAIINETRNRVNTLESKENVLLTATQTLTNKTLTTPTIASFTNAQHAHTNAASGGTIAHASLTGLTTGDPHTQYALLAGRSGGQSFSGGTAANDDLTLQGTTNATRTTSYVIMQPNGGNVGIGTTSPATTLEIVGNYTQNGKTSSITTIIAESGSAQNFYYSYGTLNPVFLGLRARGTLTSPTAIQSNDNIFILNGRGYDGTDFSGGNDNASIVFQAAENFTSTNRGTRILFSTTAVGAALPSTAMTVVGNNVGIGTTSPSTRLDIDNGALELAEMTAPGAGAANTVRIYAVDNGSGKTQLMAIFNTGAAQQLAIQP